MKSKNIPFALLACLGCLLGATVTGHGAQSFSDDFTSRIDPDNWTVISNTTLYTIDDSQGDIRISKPIGGDYSIIAAGLEWRNTLHGDFDLSVDFRNASIDRVDGSPGNQIQLNVYLGSQELALVRGDEAGAGHNIHLWRDPPGDLTMQHPTTTTSGRLRFTRTGTLMSAYLDATLVHQGNYNSEDVRVLFVLQNNGTRDATSVTFDNFSATADELLPPRRLSVDWFTIDGGGGQSAGSRFSIHGTIGQPDAGQTMVGTRFSLQGGFWQAWAVQTPGAPHLMITPAGPGMIALSWSPDEPGWILQESPSFTPRAWSDAPSGSTNPVTVPSSPPMKFYRLHKP